MLNRYALLLMGAARRRGRLHEQEYEREVDTWYRHGPGREGYRFPHCIHGTDLTTPWDPICGPCEEGIGLAESYTWQAYREYCEFEKRCTLVATVRDAGFTDVDALRALSGWAFDPIRHAVTVLGDDVAAQAKRRAGWKAMAHPEILAA